MVDPGRHTMEKEVATYSTVECNFPEKRNEDQFADRGALPAGRSGGPGTGIDWPPLPRPPPLRISF
jgi:hypothetical protein